MTIHKTSVKINFPFSIFNSPGPFNSAQRASQLEGCAPNFLKKGRTLRGTAFFGNEHFYDAALH